MKERLLKVFRPLLNVLPFLLCLIFLKDLYFIYHHYNICPETGEVLSERALIGNALRESNPEISDDAVNLLLEQKPECCKVRAYREGFSERDVFLARVAGAYFPVVEIERMGPPDGRYSYERSPKFQMSACGQVQRGRR